MRFYFLTILAVFGSAISASPDDKNDGVVTNKDVTYTMPNLAKATATVSMATAKGGPRPSNIYQGSPLDPSKTTRSDSGASATLAAKAVGGVGALLLPLLL